MQKEIKGQIKLQMLFSKRDLPSFFKGFFQLQKIIITRLTNGHYNPSSFGGITTDFLYIALKSYYIVTFIQFRSWTSFFFFFLNDSL